MATTAALLTTPSNDATFRAYGAALAAMFAAVGLVKTSDTGQINWSTATYPGTTNTDTGYEIYRFDDALQATRPIFLKVRYGRGMVSPGFRMGIDWGYSTDGAGNLTPNSSWTFVGAQTGPESSAVPRWHWMSSDGSGLVVVIANDYGTGDVSTRWDGRGVYVLDRLRNADGSPSSNGWLYFAKSGGTVSPSFYVRDLVNNQTIGGTGWNALLPAPVDDTGWSMNQEDGEMLTVPYFGLIPGTGLYQSKMALCYSVADLGAMAEVDITHLGAARRYRAHGSFMCYVDSTQRANSGLLTWIGDA